MSTSALLHARRDSRTEFEREALPHLHAVYGFALRLARRREDAHDLTKETFLRAFQRFSGFTRGTNCKAWLFTIAYSIFVNQYQCRHSEPTTLKDDDAIVLEPSARQQSRAAAAHVAADDAPTPTRKERASGAPVEAAVLQLTPEFRGAVVLVDVEGLSYEEAADVLGCTVGTVRSLLFRARKLLADRLRAHETSEYRRP